MKSSKKKALMVTLGAILMVVTIGITYAFIEQVLIGQKQVVINAGVLDLVLEEENEITISDAFPMYDEVGMMQEDVFKFRLINNGTNSVNYIIKLVEVGSGTLDKSYVKYGLTKEGNNSIGLISDLINGVIDDGVIEAGPSTINYELRLWIKDSIKDNSLIEDKSLSYKIDVEVNQKIESSKVMIAGQTFDLEVSTETSPDFSRISSDANGKGLYSFTEAGEEIYYFRGDVTNNHVLYAGMCWEMVRTTKTGGIKMIYDGLPTSDNKCINTGKASQLVDETYFNIGAGNMGGMVNTGGSLMWTEISEYSGYMYGTVYENYDMSKRDMNKGNMDGLYMYGNDVIWDGTSYTLTDTITTTGNWSTDYLNVADAHHYTCFNSTGVCSSVKYVNTVNSSSGKYIILQNGKTVADAWNEMNQNSATSPIMTNLNNWYQTNIEEAGFSDKLEDAVFCSDRSIEESSLGTWSKDGNATVNAYYSAYNRARSGEPTLECSQKDSFTKDESNGNGLLTYSVGFLSIDEVLLAGGIYNKYNHNFYLNTGTDYWMIFSSSFSSAGGEKMVGSNTKQGNVVAGVRPVISLNAETIFVSGDGSESLPFVVN